MLYCVAALALRFVSGLSIRKRGMTSLPNRRMLSMVSLCSRKPPWPKNADLIADPRDPAHVTHTGLLRARMLAIGYGYTDANDFDWLRSDPAFELACGWLPDTCKGLCSQPTVSRMHRR